MNVLKNLKLGSRLGLGFALVLALMVLMIALATVRFNGIGAASARIIEKDWVKADAAATVEAYARANARHTMELFFLSDNAQIDKVHHLVDGNNKQIAESLATLDRLEQSVEGSALLVKVKEARASFSGSYSKLDKLLDEGRRDDALKVLKGEALPAMDALQQHLLALSALQRKGVEASGAEIRQAIDSARALMLAIGLIGLCIGAGLAWGLTRSITGPIRDAVRVAQTVAAGDLTSQIEIRSGDETGQLLTALKHMNESLVGIVGQVRQSSDSIATGSAQIASGNADLSQRTEEQARNLQQTAASMEELTRR